MRSQFYHFLWSLSLAMLLGASFFLFTGESNATEQKMSNLERVCQSGYIGYAYKPKLAKRCTPLWSKWTKEIFNIK